MLQVENDLYQSAQAIIMQTLASSTYANIATEVLRFFPETYLEIVICLIKQYFIFTWGYEKLGKMNVNYSAKW